jgi:hypothetical protein
MRIVLNRFSPGASKGRVLIFAIGILVLLSIWPGTLESTAAYDMDNPPVSRDYNPPVSRDFSARSLQQTSIHAASNRVSSLPIAQAPTGPQESKVFFPVFISPGGGSPETFYVATDGDDLGGDGSEADPWGTINYALEQVPDGALILVKPGTYTGMITYERMVEQGITLRSEVPYLAHLQNNAHVVQIYHGNLLSIEGFDISHIGPGADRYIIQIQDPDGLHECGAHITLRNNVIHDSYNNDLVKVNNNASHILIEGNVFYNMGGPETDSHLDINSVDYVTIQDNIFFNDYRGSGRVNENISGHFIVLKDSNGDSDGHVGTNEITIRRNIFLNWQGNQGNAFIGLGDGSFVDYYQAQNILIENNLMLGNSTERIHAVVKATNARGVVFRSNTIVGDLPANAYFIRTLVENPAVANDDYGIYNNIWSDATGTMGAEEAGGTNDFSISPLNSVLNFALETNLYWNGPNPVPADAEDIIQYTVDTDPLLGNPSLPNIPRRIILPRLDPATGLIGGQFSTIREAFIYLVQTYGTPTLTGAGIDQADPQQMPADDILGNPRALGGLPDIGAVEILE